MSTTPTGGRWSLHGAFVTELRARVAGLQAQADATRQAGDDVLAQLLAAEVDSLRRLAARNGIDLPGDLAGATGDTSVDQVPTADAAS